MFPSIHRDLTGPFERLRSRLTRGVHNVVCFGDSPARISEEIMESIRAHVDQNGFVKVDPRRGRSVISVGRLRNLREIFERQVKGSERSMILLTAIVYQGPSYGSWVSV